MTIHIEAEENQAEWMRNIDRDADDEDPASPEHKAGKWVPYVGPQGGNGWKNSETGDVVYQDDPPGETLTADDLTDDEMQEIANQLNTDPETVEDILSTAEPEDDSGESDVVDVTRGDRVVATNEWGNEVEGVVTFNDGDFAEIELDDETKVDVETEDIKERTGSADLGDEPPEHLDPDNAEEVRPFEEYIEDEFGIEKGVTSDQMEVATMPDGSEVFVSEPPEDPSHHMHNRMLDQNEKDNMGYSMLEAIGANHPDWHYNGANGAIMTEGIDGVTLRTTSDDFEADEDSLVETMASQVLIGNGDMHQGNFIVDEDGEVTPVDLDHSTGFRVGVEHKIKAAARQAVATQHDEGSPHNLDGKIEDGDEKVEEMADRLTEEVAEMARDGGDDMLDALEDAGASDMTMREAREWVDKLKEADR